MENPRDYFCGLPARLPFEQMAKSDHFKVACQYALQQLVHDLTEDQNLNRHDAFCQLAGAKRVLDILGSLYQTPTVNPVLKHPTLNYKA